MGILTDGSKCFPVGWSAAAATVAKPCDCCRSAAALVFCRTDSMFMCMGCDARVHENARHERVWVCEVCDQAPASVTCKADAAALCVTCDRDIHSANPLAQRHERIPVVPFYNTAESVLKSTAATLFLSNNNHSNIPTATTTTTTATTTGCGGAGFDNSKLNACIGHNEQDYITDPWISSNTGMTTTSPTSKLPAHAPPSMKSIDFLFSESENFLDFDYSVSIPNNSRQSHYNSANDSVVPDHTTIKPPLNHQKTQYEIDFTRSHISSYSTTSLSQSMSSSSLDVGVVPEGSSMSEISFPYRRSVNNSVDMGNSGGTTANGGSQLLGMDREARVLRYREKRKNRKFEKTIRYASRKAYAETRPRIKGRFAKRTNVEDTDSLLLNLDTVSFHRSDGCEI